MAKVGNEVKLILSLAEATRTDIVKRVMSRNGLYYETEKPADWYFALVEDAVREYQGELRAIVANLEQGK